MFTAQTHPVFNYGKGKFPVEQGIKRYFSEAICSLALDRIVSIQFLISDLVPIFILPSISKHFFGSLQRETAPGESEHPFLASPVDAVGTVPREMNLNVTFKSQDWIGKENLNGPMTLKAIYKNSNEACSGEKPN